jgi:protein phosphatase
VVAAGRSIAGQVRDGNEDQFIVAELSRSLYLHQCGVEGFEPRAVGGGRGWVLAVADGIGGHGGGDLASAVALDAIASYMASRLPWVAEGDARHQQICAALELAVRAGQARVFETAVAKGLSHTRPGTTLTMVYVTAADAYVAHAGDSRAYLARGLEFARLTTDHTLARDIERAQARAGDTAGDLSRFEHVLSNAVGGGRAELRVETASFPLAAGDTLLVCSDGLTRYVDDSELARSLAPERGIPEICDSLVELADERGGADNITAIVARIISNPLSG